MPDTKIDRQVKSLLAIASVLILSFTLAWPAFRLYDKFYPVGLIGYASFFVGFFLVWFALTGFFYGIFYRFWYKSLLLLLAIPIVWWFYSIWRNYDEFVDKTKVNQQLIGLVVIVLVPFILGFIVNKLSKFLYNVYQEYNKLPE